MIELIPSEYDDIAFLSLVERIVNGALITLQVREVYIVHIDNWFDLKWLYWRSRGKELCIPLLDSNRVRKEDHFIMELCVPMFDPNRVRSEKHFLWDENCSQWTSVEHPKPLHLRQPGRPSLAQPLERFSKSAAFIWYSGNTVINRAGSLMLYLSGADGYAWYASFMKNEHWKIEGERRIARRELIAFEHCGSQVVPVQRESCS
jgi:hypothetical protein